MPHRAYVFDPQRIALVRQMILAPDATARKKALDQLLPMQRDDFAALFKTMEDRPVTIRLLDPPLARIFAASRR